MTTATANDLSPVKSYEHLEPLEGGSRVKGETIHVGQESRNAGRVVRWQIFVNVQTHNGGESTPRNHAVALHEIPLMRKRYGNSGSVEPRPSWVSGIARAQGLTEAACRLEEERLKRAYGDVFAHVYGGANGVPQTLWSKVIDLTRAWNDMQERCRSADRRITAEDINTVIASITPKEELAESLEAIDLPAASPAKDSGVALDGKLLQFLTDNDVPDDKAQAFAAAIAAAAGPNLTEEAWSAIPGVGAHVQKRTKLLNLYASFIAAG